MKALLAVASLFLLAAPASAQDEMAVIGDEAALEARLNKIVEEGTHPPGSLTVHLVFDARIDLDLFVTDPAQESLYFANTEAPSGGRLLADIRCGVTPAPVETVIFASAPEGRYRIGIDYPKACDPDDEGKAAFAVAVVRNTGAEYLTGTIPPRQFIAIVSEFIYDPEKGTATPVTKEDTP